MPYDFEEAVQKPRVSRSRGLVLQTNFEKFERNYDERFRSTCTSACEDS